jgi:hypothetical protein
MSFVRLIILQIVFLSALPLAAKEFRGVVVSKSSRSNVVTNSMVLDFQEWKQQEIIRAKRNLETTSTEFIKGMSYIKQKRLALKPTTEAPLTIDSISTDSLELEGEVADLREKLKQSRASLTEATELTIGDYFLLYLRGQDSKDKVLDGIGRMRPSEILQLIEEVSTTKTKI